MKTPNEFLILNKFADTAPFLRDVIAEADKNKDALGFFAASVYEEFARSEDIYVAVHRKGALGFQYAGHLIFTCRHPTAKVLQIFSDSLYRREGVARLLLDHFKAVLTEHGFISIHARVAEDLIEANKFWERQGFYIQRVAPGGTSRKRNILVRSHELASGQLFASSGLTSKNPLELETSLDTEVPMYLLDLNVLFDLGPRRVRHDDAIQLFRAERLGSCRFAISEEISKELKRTASPGKTDPMQAYTEIFPTFPYIENEDAERLTSSLARMVFPSKQANELTKNDVSDIRHLATAIQHRLAGLITNDEAILDASSKIRDAYGVHAVSPTAFRQSQPLIQTESLYEGRGKQALSLSAVSSADQQRTLDFITGLGISGSSAASEWAISDHANRVAIRHGVWFEETLIGYLVQPAFNLGGSVVAHVAVRESSPMAEHAARMLLTFLVKQTSDIGPSRITIKFPQHQVKIREVAATLGFTEGVDRCSLSKLLLGCIVTQSSWCEHRDALINAGQIKLPEQPPTFRSIEQQIPLLTPNGNKVHLSLYKLETYLGPALFCLPGRKAVITPVKRTFSQHLLGHLPQQSLLPQSHVALLGERQYLSGPATLKHFRPGNLMLFYESQKQGGLGAVVSIARIKTAYLKRQEEIGERDLDFSVLSTENLECIGRAPQKTVTVFDSVINLPNPVPMNVLKKLGCGSPTDLLTTHPITDEQLQEILVQGTQRV